MKSNYKRTFYGLFASILMSSNVHAGSASTGNVTITSIGCQTITGSQICFVAISGNPVGPAGCSSVSIRWDAANTSNGHEALAQLTAAYIAGKQVNINLSDTCFAEQTGYPTLDFYIISG